MEMEPQIVKVSYNYDFSYQCFGEAKENCIQVYNEVLPQVFDHFLENRIQKLAYYSSYGKIPYRAKEYADLLPFSSSGSTYLALFSQLIDSKRFTNVSKAFSALFGGSFRNAYDYLLPIPIIDKNRTIGYARIYPREHFNAEAAPFLLSLSPGYMNILKSIIKKSILHSSSWYSVSINIMKTPSSASQLSYRMSFDLVFLLDPLNSAIHREFLKDSNVISLQDQNKPNISLTFFPLSKSEPVRNSNSHTPPITIDRFVQDHFNTEFETITTLKSSFPSISSQEKVYANVIEIIPMHYSMYLHSIRYAVYSSNYTVLKTGNLLDIVDNYRISNPDCHHNHHQQYNRADKPSCDFSFSFDYSLHPEESLVYTITARKNFLSLPNYPPDGSYGIHILPAIVQFRTIQSQDYDHMQITEMFLLQRPIPDLSMPFNVITLVGTVVAFLVGSIINAWIRKHSKK